LPTLTESAWQEISTAALLGTQRQPFKPPALPGAVSAVIGAPAGGGVESETLLLRAAAVTALHRKAGRLPAAGSPPDLPVCPQEERQRCSVPAAECLERILSSGCAFLLAEWAGLVEQHGLRIREEHLPELLSQQKNIQPIRAAILPILGKRGRWLAAQNPDWNTFVYFSEEKTWLEGRHKERLLYLCDLRARNPQAARALLAATWEEEPPGERAIFLQALSAGLDLEDESFLENALNDRRKEVRTAASELLAQLPGSRLVQRMTERAQTLLTWKSGLLRGAVETHLPESCSAEMQRDGIDPKTPAGLPLGEKAWWLAQILARIPPSTWSSTWNKKASSLFDAARKHELEEALIYGWREAALRFADDEWIEAAILYEIRRDDARRMYKMFTRLPKTHKEGVMAVILRDRPTLAYDQPASIWLSNCQFLWSRDLTTAVTSCICWTLQKGDLQPWRWEILLREIGSYFNPEQLENAIERIREAQKKREQPDPYARNLLAVLQFRLEMHQVFRQDFP
jgi:hypothetical protein